MLELSRIPQTASMQDIKNRTGDVTKKSLKSPVMLMNRATPQAIIVSPSQWNAIVDRLEELQDAISTLQAELAIATGQTQVETIEDAATFMQEIMGTRGSIPA